MNPVSIFSLLIVLFLALPLPGRAESLLVFSARFYAPGKGKITHFHLYTIRPDGTSLRQWTDGKSDDIEPKWTSDGKRILFLRSWANGSKPDSVSELDIETKSVRTLFSGQPGNYLHDLKISPDGKRFLILQNYYTAGVFYKSSLYAGEIADNASTHRVGIKEGFNISSAEWASSDRILGGYDSVSKAGVTSYASAVIDWKTGAIQNELPTSDLIARQGDWILCASENQNQVYNNTGKKIGEWKTPGGDTQWWREDIFASITYIGSVNDPSGPDKLRLYRATGDLMREASIVRDYSSLAAQFRQGRELHDLRNITALPDDKNRFLWGAFVHRAMPGLQLIVDSRTGSVSFWSSARYVTFAPDGKYYASTSNVDWTEIGKKTNGQAMTEPTISLLVAPTARPNALTPIVSGQVCIDGFDWRPQ
ncbi:MAG: hypothetical protein WCP07_01435 [bacterium]